MKRNSQTIQNYAMIADDIKFLPKSLIRLKILETLYKSPMDMKEMKMETQLNYSAISNTTHMLELKSHIYKDNNKYHLSNTMYSHMDAILKINRLIDLLDKLSPISNNHIVECLPDDSICDVHRLENIHLIESDGFNIHKTYEYIEKSIKKAKYVNAILPFSYNNFNNSFNRLLSKKRDVYLITPLDIKEIFIKNLDISKNNLKIEYLDKDISDFLLLICTDKKMMLGFFKDDMHYDQNRLLVSGDRSCINWANELFENFKNGKC